MKDRLTKKRVKVDYEAIIDLLDLGYSFRCYQLSKKSCISLRRQMLAFLRSKEVAIYWCHLALKNGCKNLVDLTNYCGSYSAAMEYAYGV